jgi:hypothetical protein
LLLATEEGQLTATRDPEKKVIELLRKGKAVYIWENYEGLHVLEAFSQLPEWLARKGGIFAWDPQPFELDEWRLKRGV